MLFISDVLGFIPRWREADMNGITKATPSGKIRNTPPSTSCGKVQYSCDTTTAISRNSAPSTDAFQILSAWLRPSNDDARFWWHMIGSHLALLFQEAGYDIHSQYGSLLFLYHSVVGRMGPRPSSSGSPQFWKSFMTDDFTPIEYSWSWDTPKAPPKIRFSIEAIGPDAGTKIDPFNQAMTMELARHVNAVAPDVDWDLFNHFRKEFCSQELWESACVEGHNPQESHSSSMFMAFEMNKRDVAVKAYFVPVKAEQTGQSRLSVVSDSIRSLERPDFRLPAYHHISAFMTDHPDGSQLEIVGIAVDCVLPKTSRLKVYVRSPRTSFDSVCTVMSMGGKSSIFSPATLIDFKKLWQLTLGLDEDFASDENLHPKRHQTAGILYNFDIKAGNILPEPKVYIPVKHYAPNDLAVAKGLASYLSLMGRDRFMDGYMRALEGMCNHRSLDSQCGLQTYISCSVKKEQLVLTSYFSPEVYHDARW
ncbi:hypothetical protein GJ744_004963 [Endocarpon pusillum]|uniref:Dimethylallyl tryptophan synthase n=1 Tax=Endocarpon pusillum TaxID=364733 RepID=A0A8H7A668_9EURO|nr:hypothetical protein GJ744_004963 [Endocarpon pusillum]